MATMTNKFWGIGVFGASLWYGGSVAFGHIPGMTSGVGTFERIAALTAKAVEAHGYVLTGFGAFILGSVVAVLCLISGEGSADSGGWFGGDGDGGGGD